MIELSDHLWGFVKKKATEQRF